MAWKTSDFALPDRGEQAIAAPGEVRVLKGWSSRPIARCNATRIVQVGDDDLEIQVCILPSGHDGDHNPA